MVAYYLWPVADLEISNKRVCAWTGFLRNDIGKTLSFSFGNSFWVFFFFWRLLGLVFIIYYLLFIRNLCFFFSFFVNLFFPIWKVFSIYIQLLFLPSFLFFGLKKKTKKNQILLMVQLLSFFFFFSFFFLKKKIFFIGKYVGLL